MKKRKIFSIIISALLVVTLVFALAACGNKQQGTATVESSAVDGSAPGSYTLKSGDDFVVGFDAEYPPYGYMAEDGSYTGFDLELAEAICKNEGWNLVYYPLNWDTKDMELNSGAIDCIWSGFTINGREADYEWTVPYVNNSQAVVVGKDSGIKTLADLAGKKVGTQAASAAEGLLTEGGDQEELGKSFASLQTFGDYNTAFTELMSGALDAVAIDIGVAKYQVNTRGEGKFVVLEEPLNAEEYGIGFKLGNKDLRDQVEAALMKLVEDGTYAKLAEKYELTDFIVLGK